jgi:hypothetical protein
MKRIITLFLLLGSLSSYAQIYGADVIVEFGIGDGTRSTLDITEYYEGTTNAYINSKDEACVVGKVLSTERGAERGRWSFELHGCKQVDGETILVGTMGLVQRIRVYDSGQTNTRMDFYNALTCAPIKRLKKSTRCDFKKLILNGHELSL